MVVQGGALRYAENLAAEGLEFSEALDALAERGLNELLFLCLRSGVVARVILGL
jgi:hypothetical protein